MSILDRMVLAVERVRDRLMRCTAALNAANIPYAIVGGNAVAAWVASVDPAAVRNTQDVNLLLRSEDLDAAGLALAKAGFIRRHVAGMDMFLDGPDAKARDAIHVIHAGKKVRPESIEPAPGVDSVETVHSAVWGGAVMGLKVISLESLVRMKLTSNRRKDQVHLQDMLEVGLIDASWTSRYGPELAARLQNLIDNPD